MTGGLLIPRLILKIAKTARTPKEEFYMDKKRERNNTYPIDISELRQKGLAVEKISQIMDIPIHDVDRQLKQINRYKESSGVF